MWEIILLCLLVAIVVAMAIGMVKQKKEMANLAERLSTIKVGDKVKTQLGVYGTVKSITGSTDGKIVILETGSAELEINFNLITGLDDRQVLELDAEGNIIPPVIPEEVPAVAAEAVKAEEVKAEEKPEVTEDLAKPKKPQGTPKPRTTKKKE